MISAPPGRLTLAARAPHVGHPASPPGLLTSVAGIVARAPHIGHPEAPSVSQTGGLICERGPHGGLCLYKRGAEDSLGETLFRSASEQTVLGLTVVGDRVAFQFYYCFLLDDCYF